jgi:hypothetical protein
MAYILNRPTPTDTLNDSQPIIQGNFNSANTTFGIEHYSFADATSNIGLHDTVTTPLIIGGVHPTPTTAPIFYGMQDSPNLGLIHYSMPPAPSGAVATPITSIQSGPTPIVLANNQTTNVMDFAGVTWAFGQLFGYNVSNSTSAGNVFAVSYFLWHLIPTTPTATKLITFNNAATNSLFQIGATGSILQIKCTTGSGLNNIYWTLHMERIVQ